MWLAEYRRAKCRQNCPWLLTFHYSTGAECFVELQVASKGRYSRDRDDHPIFLTVSRCANNAFDNGRANLVLNRLLLVARGSDEKLILNVDEVFAVADDLAVCILNRMLRLVVSLGLSNVGCLFTDLSVDQVVAPFG